MPAPSFPPSTHSTLYVCARTSAFRAHSAPSDKLFELVFSCRKDDHNGDLITSKEECGIESVCLDTSTDPETSEITYQVCLRDANLMREEATLLIS